VSADPAPPPAEPVALALDGVTHGGEAVGRLPDGRACFVPYAIPGERVVVRVVEDHGRWTRGALVEVVEASPDRAVPPCPHFGPDRCGGCQLQHITPAAQAALKRRIVVEQLQRIGRIPDPPVAETVRVADLRYRNTARFGVDAQGRLGFRRAGSRDLHLVDDCRLLAPPAQALREEAGDAWRGAAEVVVRRSLTTGDRALVVAPGPDGIPEIPEGDVPLALVPAAPPEGPPAERGPRRRRGGRPDRGPRAGAAVALRGDPTVHEVVAGRAFAVSPGSFFQSNTAGAEVLVDLARRAAGVRPGETALDLHAGVGLFAAALAEDGATVEAVEADQGAAADARRNLADLEVTVTAGDALRRVRALVAEGAAVDVVVLDPPRRGAGPDLCRAITALGPRVVVYVACDPAALARDAAALTAAGYALSEAVPVDQFAQTAQIETVATFTPVP